MGKNLKILGLALLALVAVMAVSASAAQAKWLLLESGASVSLLNIEGESTENGKLLVENGIEIECGGSTGTAHVSLSEENKKLSGSATVTFNECVELNFGEVCETHSEGAEDGVIVSGGSGVGGMESAEVVYLQAGQQHFTTVEFTSPNKEEECPLEGIDGSTTGEVRITALNALLDQALHVVHIEPKNLEFGEEPATIDNEAETGSVILGSITLENGHTFAAHLVGPL